MAKEPTISDLSPEEFLELMIYALHITSREEGILLADITETNSANSKAEAKRLAEWFFKV